MSRDEVVETKFILTFTGPNAELAADAFWGWFLDGGGDDGFQATCEDRGVEILDEDYNPKNRREINFQVD